MRSEATGTLSVVALWTEVPRLVGDDDFGLHLAELAAAGPQSLGGQMIAASPTLGEGLRRVLRFERIFHDVRTSELVLDGDEAAIVHDTRGGLPLPRHAAEFGWAWLVLIARRVTGASIAPRRVAFGHPAPPHLDEHVRVLGARPSFGAEIPRLVLARADLDRASTEADAALAEILDSHARGLLARLPASPELVAQVRAAVLEALTRGELSVAVVARRLGVSPRTLQRRLAAEHGTSFQAVVDDLRAHLARQWLGERALAVAEVPMLTWPRLHLMEWNDQPWLPEALRRAETDYLATILDAMDPFAPLAPRLAALCTDRIIDLCAGGAGPWLRLQPAISHSLGRPVHVTMTDLYPNTTAFSHTAAATSGAVTGEPSPIDARAVPPHLSGLRTMFDALHHFRPADARAVLADAHRRRQPIAIVEATRRSLATVLGTLLVPLFVLLLTPRIRPFSFPRLLFTYVLPIVPLLIFWDGLVSCLRSYRPSELLALTAGLDDSYTWDAGTYRHRGLVVTYLIGAPR